MIKKGFTLAEILITLTIIGVVAAITLPSVMTNVTQNQYKTGLKKAINVLNDSLQTNLAQEGDTPYNMSDITLDVDGDGRLSVYDVAHLNRLVSDRSDGKSPVLVGLSSFLGRHMNIVKTAIIKEQGVNSVNIAFYTTDGLRFEAPAPLPSIQCSKEEDGSQICYDSNVSLPLYETSDAEKDTIVASTGYSSCGIQEYLTKVKCPSKLQACGSLGLITNPNNTNVPPCVVIVDVNGDKKPNPKAKIPFNDSHGDKRADTVNFIHEKYTTPNPNDNMLSDVFTLLVTDRHVIPYGVVAQRTMYNEE